MVFQSKQRQARLRQYTLNLAIPLDSIRALMALVIEFNGKLWGKVCLVA